MTKRRWIIVIVSVLVVGGLAFLLLRPKGAQAQNYQTATVKRGDLQATVTSTGTITAVGTVAVGTQVSGTVEEVLVDYNDQVRKGQLLARLDTRVLQAAIEDAKANLDKAKAQYAAALDEYNRNKSLFDKKYISAIEFNQYRSGYQSAQASVRQAQIAVQRAQTNLGYAEIRSPVDGTVIQRSVEPGQTVAASLSTPTLFTIARDLSNMQIEAQVDEGDIGQIKNGQRVSFTVQSQPDKTFTGLVQQIRLQPQTVQNVVNYTVVVAARNQDNLLLPGMTATVNFEVQHVNNVLIVPNAALRFQPPAEVLEAMQADRAARDSSAGGNRTMARTATTTGDSTRGRDTARRSGAGRRSRVWTLDQNGQLKMIAVGTGLSDGSQTEISGRDVKEGMVVVTGIAQSGTGGTRRTTTGGLPFGGAPSGGGGGRRGF